MFSYLAFKPFISSYASLILSRKMLSSGGDSFGRKLLHAHNTLSLLAAIMSIAS